MPRTSLLTTAFIVSGLGIAAHYMTTPLVPLAAVHAGANTAGVGLATGVFAFLPLLLAVPIGLLADRVGQGRVAIAGMGMMTVATAALALPSFAAIVCAQALRGLGQVSLVIGVQGFIAATVARGSRRQMAYSSFVLAVSAGQLAGPALGGWVAGRSGLPSAFLAAAGVTLLGALLGLRLGRRTTPDQAADAAADVESAADLRDSFSLLRERPVKGAVTVSASVLLQMTLGTAFYPLLMKGAGWSVTAIGLLIALRGAGACCGRPALAPLLRIAGDRWRLLRGVFCVMCVATASTPLLPAVWYQCLVSVIIGLASGITQPITMAVVADHSGEHRRSQGVALRVCSNRVLQFSGPLCLGLIGDHTGLGGVFAVGGLAPLLGLLPLRGLGRRAAPPRPERA